MSKMSDKSAKRSAKDRLTHDGRLEELRGEERCSGPVAFPASLSSIKILANWRRWKGDRECAQFS